MEGNFKATYGSVSSQSKMKSGFNIGGNYLFQFDDDYVPIVDRI